MQSPELSKVINKFSLPEACKALLELKIQTNKNKAKQTKQTKTLLSRKETSSLISLSPTAEVCEVISTRVFHFLVPMDKQDQQL